MSRGPTLKRSLGLWAIVILGLGYMSPTVVFDTFGIASNATNNVVPLAYIVALAAMLFTAISYGKMVRAFPSSGTAYTYTQKSINPHIGFLVGWASLLDYLLIPVVNALLLRIYFNSLFPSVPAWLWVLGYVIIVTGVNVWSIKSTANFNTIFVAYQVLLVVVFIFLAIWQLHRGMGYGTILTSQPFIKPDIQLSGIVAGATILCFSFLGFDAVTTYCEETPDPTKTIPKAIFLTVLIGGAIFIIASYFIQALNPTLAHFKNTDDTLPEIALFVAGKVFQLFFLAGSIAGAFASGLASHASVSRLMYVMGRDGALPKKVFGYIHPRLQTPVANVVFVGVFSLTAIFFSLNLIASFINFGALIAFTFVNLSVIAHYAIRKKMCKSIKDFLTYVVLPVIGAGCVAVLWYSLQGDALTAGLIWLVIGFLYLLFVTKFFRSKPIDINFEESEQSTPINE